MTRSKELRRIERAIEHQDHADLRWALDYCEMRLRLVSSKQGASYWRSLAKRIRAALDDET
jgi:hypothetical protein